jgi:hypothetical protein
MSTAVASVLRTESARGWGVARNSSERPLAFCYLRDAAVEQFVVEARGMTADEHDLMILLGSAATL